MTSFPRKSKIQRYREMVKLAESGWSKSEIARKYEVSPQRVAQIFEKPPAGADKPETHVAPNKATHPHLEDATEPFLMQVRREHVRGSVVMDIHACAGARALQSVPHVVDAWVMKSRTFIEFDDGRLLRYQNPHPLRKIVNGFDSTAGLFPEGDYMLAPVQPSARNGAVRYTRGGGHKADRNDPARVRHHSYKFR